MNNEERKIALFIDLENLALGVRDAKYDKFDIELLLKRLVEKGKIIAKRAYADWSRFNEYKRPLHEQAIELIDIPQKRIGGKNSADIRLVVDAMDLCQSKEHVDAFTIASGDSDFSPLVSKLRENNKYVIGIGVKNSTSELLVRNCDEFIYYEDLIRVQRDRKPKVAKGVSAEKAEGFTLLAEAFQALLRENYEVIYASMVKQTMKRKQPSFDETGYGYSNFTQMLKDAALHKFVAIEKDNRSGTYTVKSLGEDS